MPLYPFRLLASEATLGDTERRGAAHVGFSDLYHLQVNCTADITKGTSFGLNKVYSDIVIINSTNNSKHKSNKLVCYLYKWKYSHLHIYDDKMEFQIKRELVL